VKSLSADCFKYLYTVSQKRSEIYLSITQTDFNIVFNFQHTIDCLSAVWCSQKCPHFLLILMCSYLMAVEIRHCTVVSWRSPKFHCHCGGRRPLNQHRHCTAVVYCVLSCISGCCFLEYTPDSRINIKIPELATCIPLLWRSHHTWNHAASGWSAPYCLLTGNWNRQKLRKLNINRTDMDITEP